MQVLSYNVGEVIFGYLEGEEIYCDVNTRRQVPAQSHSIQGEVVSFVIQYETKFEGRWLPVVRFDTEHGFAHRDSFDHQGNRQKMPLFTRDYNEALTFAEFDIKANWRIYKRAFRGGDGNGRKS